MPKSIPVIFPVLMLSAVLVIECLWAREAASKSASEALVYSEYEFDVQELFARRNGNNIYGVLYLPRAAGKNCPRLFSLTVSVEIIGWERRMPRLSLNRDTPSIVLISAAAVRKVKVRDPYRRCPSLPNKRIWKPLSPCWGNNPLWTRITCSLWEPVKEGLFQR